MNKKILITFIICVWSFTVFAQIRHIDSVAVSILDRMSTLIGDLQSCSVKISTSYDIQNQSLGLVKHSDIEQLYLHGPNKLFINTEGDRGPRNFYFDGKKLSYYSLDKNQYSEMNVPISIIKMIDSAHNKLGIDFPAADFFYPGFVDDIIAESKNLVYLGITKVNGKECFHIAGKAKDKSYQFWITNDAYYLPIKLDIVYTEKAMNPQYEAILTDWQINPILPDKLFEFSAPPRSKKIKLGTHGK